MLKFTRKYLTIAALKNTDHVISKQYPNEIEDRRNFSWKQYKDAKVKGHNTHFDNTGQLYINGTLKPHIDKISLPPLSAGAALAGMTPMTHAKSDIQFINEQTLQAIAFSVKDRDEIAEARDNLLSDIEAIMDATHIPFAYRLSTGAEFYDSDKDYFAGSHILSIMKKLKITDKVIFVLHHEPSSLITLAEKRDCIENIIKAACKDF